MEFRWEDVLALTMLYFIFKFIHRLLKSYNKLNTRLKYSTHSDRTVYLCRFFFKNAHFTDYIL